LQHHAHEVDAYYNEYRFGKMPGLLPNSFFWLIIRHDLSVTVYLFRIVY
jgi:hypothetical protein